MTAIYKLLSITILAFTLWSCGSNSETKKNNFSIKTSAKKNIITLGEPLKLSIKNPKNVAITSVSYKLGDQTIPNEFKVEDVKLGVQKITASITTEDGTDEVSTRITILNNQKPKLYTFNIINEYPHDITSYTQGLEFHDGYLYESTGQYNESKLRKVDYKTGEVLQNTDLERQYFGEGMTIMNDKIYQLTWRENTGFVYQLDSFEKISTFTYGQSKEGWGLCNDSEVIYKSDGTENIWILDPNTLQEKDHIQVYRDKGKIINLNELEWIDGKIYANNYQYNGVTIINPENGAVEGVIDFSPLHKKVKQHPGLDVLNGIAYNPETKTLFVTGKRWNKLFEVEIIEK
ncbi:glutaminyl-peptide cyclotransferase [Mangrovimonas sp. TPBH4]|uniref:glutaminyl-peptide cyclotransferase n=1 Tax=Mangrovimonas sp. TPBH4 TaxID=1645914 RepID=UPI0006B5C8A4|nr:glutaminyl-peptide cyclotransferase [Mangrovimonas sp. TPBH4]